MTPYDAFIALGMLNTTFTCCDQCSSMMMAGRPFCVCCGGKAGSMTAIVLAAGDEDEATEPVLSRKSLTALATLYLKVRFPGQSLKLNSVLSMRDEFKRWVDDSIRMARAASP